MFKTPQNVLENADMYSCHYSLHNPCSVSCTMLQVPQPFRKLLLDAGMQSHWCLQAAEFQRPKLSTLPRLCFIHNRRALQGGAQITKPCSSQTLAAACKLTVDNHAHHKHWLLPAS
jgi:hypothetical protein